MDKFKPSDVSLLHSFPPLVDIMGKTELENAAMLILRALVRGGDEWKPVGPKDMGTAIDADLRDNIEPLKALSRNPFFNPDFSGLVDKGFARWTSDEKLNRLIEFTEQGIEALRSHVIPRNT